MRRLAPRNRQRQRKDEPSRNAYHAEPDNRLWATDMGNGFIIETSGAPPPRLPEELQPVLIHDGQGRTVAPPVEPEAPAEAPKVTPDAPAKHWRSDYGLGKRT